MVNQELGYINTLLTLFYNIVLFWKTFRLSSVSRAERACASLSWQRKNLQTAGHLKEEEEEKIISLCLTLLFRTQTTQKGTKSYLTTRLLNVTTCVLLLKLLTLTLRLFLVSFKLIFRGFAKERQTSPSSTLTTVRNGNIAVATSG